MFGPCFDVHYDVSFLVCYHLDGEERELVALLNELLL